MMLLFDLEFFAGLTIAQRMKFSIKDFFSTLSVIITQALN